MAVAVKFLAGLFTKKFIEFKGQETVSIQSMELEDHRDLGDAPASCQHGLRFLPLLGTIEEFEVSIPYLRFFCDVVFGGSAAGE